MPRRGCWRGACTSACKRTPGIELVCDRSDPSEVWVGPGELDTTGNVDGRRLVVSRGTALAAPVQNDRRLAQPPAGFAKAGPGRKGRLAQSPWRPSCSAVGPVSSVPRGTERGAPECNSASSKKFRSKSQANPRWVWTHLCFARSPGGSSESGVGKGRFWLSLMFRSHRL